MKKLIVIPAYNEAANIPSVVASVREHCPQADYIVVNDCSTDDTAAVCQGIDCPYLNLYSNLGFSGAVQAGFRYALANGYDVVVQIDGDGQHPADRVADLFKAIEDDEADYVIGSRFVGTKKPLTFRMLGSRLLSGLIRMKTGRHILDPTSGMRAVNRDLIRKMASNLNFIAEPDTVVRAVLSGYRVKELSVTMSERMQGISHFANPFNSAKYMVRMCLSILLIQGRRWR